jgi:dihydrofolate reductase
MRDLAVLTFLTLDGVMQAPGQPEEDPSGGFVHGGWSVNYWGEVMAQVMEEAMAAPYDLLLGRKTYESFAAYWPQVDNDPAADKLNNATKFVATSTLSELEWKNSIRITGDIAAEVSRLKDQDGPLLQIHGSWQLIQTLLAHELIDEFRLWTFPLVVGPGKRLFGQETVPTDLTLVKTKTTSNGVMMSIYSRVGTLRQQS